MIIIITSLFVFVIMSVYSNHLHHFSCNRTLQSEKYIENKIEKIANCIYCEF